MKLLASFFRFWYDFIVGDAWEVAAGVVIALIIAWLLLRIQPALSTVLGPLFAVAIVALTGASVWQEQRRRSR